MANCIRGWNKSRDIVLRFFPALQAGTLTETRGARRKDTMITNWSEWKRYPKAARGETLQAPIGPGVFEVRHASSGALFAFEAVDNIAHALSSITSGSKSFVSWFGKRDSAMLPDLEYRTFTTSTREEAKVAAERMIGRREAYMSHVA